MSPRAIAVRTAFHAGLVAGPVQARPEDEAIGRQRRRRRVHANSAASRAADLGEPPGEPGCVAVDRPAGQPGRATSDDPRRGPSRGGRAGGAGRPWSSTARVGSRSSTMAEVVAEVADEPADERRAASRRRAPRTGGVEPVDQPARFGERVRAPGRGLEDGHAGSPSGTTSPRSGRVERSRAGRAPAGPGTPQRRPSGRSRRARVVARARPWPRLPRLPDRGTRFGAEGRRAAWRSPGDDRRASGRGPQVAGRAATLRPWQAGRIRSIRPACYRTRAWPDARPICYPAATATGFSIGHADHAAPLGPRSVVVADARDSRAARGGRTTSATIARRSGSRR